MERRGAAAMVIAGLAVAAATGVVHVFFEHSLGHENVESVDLVTLPIAFFLLAEGGLNLWKQARLRRLDKP